MGAVPNSPLPIRCLSTYRGSYNYHIKFGGPKRAKQSHPGPIQNVWRAFPANSAITKTTKTTMHTPHDGTWLPHRSMSVGDAPPTVSRLHYTPN